MSKPDGYLIQWLFSLSCCPSFCASFLCRLVCHRHGLTWQLFSSPDWPETEDYKAKTKLKQREMTSWMTSCKFGSAGIWIGDISNTGTIWPPYEFGIWLKTVVPFMNGAQKQLFYYPLIFFGPKANFKKICFAHHKGLALAFSCIDGSRSVPVII